MAKAVKVKLDKNRMLRFNGSALVRFEQETGRNILKGELDELSFGELLVLLFCGCLHEDPELTLEKLQDGVDLSVVAALKGKVAEALVGDLPKEMTEAPKDAAAPSPAKAKS
jgi:hypothetical protein